MSNIIDLYKSLEGPLGTAQPSVINDSEHDLPLAISCNGSDFFRTLQESREIGGSQESQKKPELSDLLSNRDDGDVTFCTPRPLPIAQPQQTPSVTISPGDRDVPPALPVIRLVRAPKALQKVPQSYNVLSDCDDQEKAVPGPEAISVPAYRGSMRGVTRVEDKSTDRGDLKVPTSCAVFRILGASKATPKTPKSHNLLSDGDDGRETAPGPEDVSGWVYTDPVRGVTRVVDQDEVKRKRQDNRSPEAGEGPSSGKKPKTPRGTKFPGSICRSYKDGLALALKPQIVGLQAFFVDASVRSGCAAVAASWRVPNSGTGEWEGQGTEVPFPCEDSEVAEIFAIGNAMVLSIKKIQSCASQASASRLWQVVLIFSDSDGAVQRIQRYDTKTGVGAFASAQRETETPRFKEVLDFVIVSSQALSRLGTRIKLYLVPGHSGVPGNVAADRLAYKTAKLLADRKEAAPKIASNGRLCGKDVGRDNAKNP